MITVKIMMRAVAVVILFSGLAHAGVINVPGDQPTIQAGIDAAVNGDEVVVKAGTYNETINFNGKAITVRSDSGDPNDTTIDGIGFFHVVRCVSAEGPNTVLDGFSVIGGEAAGATPPDDRGGGMYNYKSSPTVTNCIFEGNHAKGVLSEGGGMYNEVSNPIVSGCIFSLNTSEGHGGGMHNADSNAMVTNCTFINNSAQALGGGMCNENSNPTLTSCTFIGNSSIFFNGGGMASFSGGSSPILTDCTFTFNTAMFKGGGIYSEFSGTTLTNCNFSSNMAQEGGGMSAIGSRLRMVTQCTFSNNSATINGGGIHNQSSDNKQKVTNCTFSGNSADEDGGGMYNTIFSNPTVTNCTFSDNSAKKNGGGMNNNNSSKPSIISCLFSGNTAELEGGGMYNYFGSDPMVTHCRFIDNKAINGGGMRNRSFSEPLVTNCIFSHNLALDGNGAGMSNYVLCSPTVINCTFSANEIINNPVGAGGMSSEETSSPTVTNTIFWGNLPEQVGYDVNSIRQITYSLVQGGSAGVGNVDADPLFFDPGNDELQLLDGSPAIDAGSNGVTGGPLDLDGNNRYVDDPDTVDTGIGPGPIVDMGAYEFGASTCSCDNGLLGDINCDGVVNWFDISLLALNWLVTI